MTYKGKMKNGVVVLDGGHAPPDGAPVSVRLLKPPGRLKPFIGIADDLPSDISINHDHYLYGTPKQE